MVNIQVDCRGTEVMSSLADCRVLVRKEAVTIADILVDRLYFIILGTHTHAHIHTQRERERERESRFYLLTHCSRPETNALHL